jgi:hypothetical protein
MTLSLSAERGSPASVLHSRWIAEMSFPAAASSCVRVLGIERSSLFSNDELVCLTNAIVADMCRETCYEMGYVTLRPPAE